MVTKNLGNPQDGAGQGKAPWWALPDRWNPRVWVRDWLNRATNDELLVIEARRAEYAAERVQIEAEIASRAAARISFYADVDLNDEARLAGRLREQLSRMQGHSERWRQIQQSGASEAPDTLERQPDRQRQQTSGEPE